MKTPKYVILNNKAHLCSSTTLQHKLDEKNWMRSFRIPSIKWPIIYPNVHHRLLLELSAQLLHLIWHL